jgi:hypothetical protein
MSGIILAFESRTYVSDTKRFKRCSVELFQGGNNCYILTKNQVLAFFLDSDRTHHSQLILQIISQLPKFRAHAVPT